MSRLTEMETLAAVVEEGGFTAAALRLGVSKSAVSKQISALEARLGARLLTRTTRRVTPTEIGLAFYQRARQILRTADEAESLVAELNATPSGRLSISVPTGYAALRLAPRLPEFIAAYPEISIALDATRNICGASAEGYDLIIRIGPQPDSSLKARKVDRFGLRLVASPAYLEAHGRPASVTDLARHQLLGGDLRGNPETWTLPDRMGRTRRFATSQRFGINDDQGRLAAAIAGLGIARLPDFWLTEALADGRLEPVLPTLDSPRQCVYALHPTGQFTPPKTRAFIDFLAGTATECDRTRTGQRAG